jgi:hypothetical protein
MALDLYSLENGRIGEHLLSIEDEMFRNLVRCFAIVQKRSGITVDEYGELKLPWRSYGVILDGIKEARLTSQNKDEIAALGKLEAVLLELDRRQSGAIFVGD